MMDPLPIQALIQNKDWDPIRFLNALGPLVEQVLETHQNGKLAPLQGCLSLQLFQGQLYYGEDEAFEPRQTLLNKPKAHDGLRIICVPTDPMASPNADLNEPAYVVGYLAWENLLGQHDFESNLFLLGLILTSVALNLDFYVQTDLETMVKHRTTYFAFRSEIPLNLRLLLVAMTDLDPARRPTAETVLRCLKGFVLEDSQPQIESLNTGPDQTKKILAHLRDRLFDLSKRNKLLNFQEGPQWVNVSLDCADPHAPELAKPLQWADLSKFFRPSGAAVEALIFFQIAPYRKRAWEKMRIAAQRSLQEVGFYPLKVVLGRLTWRNPLENGPSFCSPLLLVDSHLHRKGGQLFWRIEPGEAEVNPVLRFVFRQKFQVGLPAHWDVQKDPDLLQLQSLIQNLLNQRFGILLSRKSHPDKLDFAQKVRRRHQTWLKQKKHAGFQLFRETIPYSYRKTPRLLLGQQLFLSKVAPAPLALISESDSVHEERDPVPDLSAERMDDFHLNLVRSSVWELDTSQIFLGCFNLQKLSLLNDYDQLMDQPLQSLPFEQVFSPPTFSSSAMAQLDQPAAFLELSSVLPIDPSQAEALFRARTGESLIIQGPPGTGKSQTIVNLIADKLAQGKRVLFVCEKRVALDVVYQRLQQSGLGAFACLIHDARADKKRFLMEVKAAMQHAESCHTTQVAERHEKWRDHAQTQWLEWQACANTRFQALPQLGLPYSVFLQRLNEIGLNQRRAIDVPEQVELAGFLAARNLLAALEQLCLEQGLDPIFANNAFAAVVPREFEPSRFAALRQRIEWVDETLIPIREAFNRFGQAGVQFETWAQWLSFGDIWLQSRFFLQGGEGQSCLNQQGLESLRTHVDTYNRLLQKIQRLQDKNRHWRRRPEPNQCVALFAELKVLERRRSRYVNPRWWLLNARLSWAYPNRDRRKKWSRLVSDLLAEEQAQQELAAFAVEAADWLPADDLPATIRFAEGFLQQFGQLAPQIQKALLKAWSATNLSQHAEWVGSLQSLAGTMKEIWQGWSLGQPQSFQTQIAWLLSNWACMTELRPLLFRLADISPALLRLIQKAPVSLRDIEIAIYQNEFHKLWARDSSFAQFDESLKQQTDAVQSVARWLTGNARSINERNCHRYQAAKKTAFDCSGPESESWRTGLKLLQHEFSKKRQHLPVRKVNEGPAGPIVRCLKPVWLMSPLSIAETLPLDPDLFDTVIFDEASQIRLEDAIPTLFRGKQVIVVGDQQQLPPSSFFQTRQMADDYGLFSELDPSFLSHCNKTLPCTRLLWHYRSRYENLIRFSNSTFYDDALLTVPDPHATGAPQREPCIEVHYLTEGRFVDRANGAEAEFVASWMREHLVTQDVKSVGLVAFSEAQQSAIEAALDQLAEKDPIFGPIWLHQLGLMEDGAANCLFIKNLENVQGDERDIILLSLGYGPDQDKRLRLNFGPVLWPGGEKRLNVLFSRAREKMVVVCSIQPEQITNLHNRGARTLRAFLEFAWQVAKPEGDRLQEWSPHIAITQPAADGSWLHGALVKQLEARGWLWQADFGNSDFRCDWVVRHQQSPVWQVAILLMKPRKMSDLDVLARWVVQPQLLASRGWHAVVLSEELWIADQPAILKHIESILDRP
ncbi:MAG: DUF4011 domain-containing protein [Acidobacteria bacterium]|nr:DUF4011 domain-containing protein [Acidobacteriota bacterium]